MNSDDDEMFRRLLGDMVAKMPIEFSTGLLLDVAEAILNKMKRPDPGPAYNQFGSCGRDNLMVSFGTNEFADKLEAHAIHLQAGAESTMTDVRSMVIEPRRKS